MEKSKATDVYEVDAEAETERVEKSEKVERRDEVGRWEANGAEKRDGE